MKRILALITAILSCVAAQLSAQVTATDTITNGIDIAETIADETTPVGEQLVAPRISLLTARAGADIYQLEGHSALRIVTPDGLDYVVNWGLFDFNSPNFVYRFVKGETDYMAGAAPTERFLQMYRREGRKVIEQQLDLTQVEATRVIELTEDNLRPENRTYRYNYVLDNCATRPLAIIERALGDSLRLSNSDLPDHASSTFRNAMRYYHKNYPWYQFGIDLALGSGIDRHISNREVSFAPEALENMLDGATRPDGRPIVCKRMILVDTDTPTAVLPPTPYPLTPMCWSLITLGVALICTITQLGRRRTTVGTRLFDTLYYTLAGCAGLILTFLIFVSTHEATSPNWLYLWLNPCCFVGAVAVWAKRGEKLLYFYQFVNFALLIVLAVALMLGAQSPNPAFIPLIAADGVRAIAYIIQKQRSSNRFQTPNRCHPAKADR